MILESILLWYIRNSLRELEESLRHHKSLEQTEIQLVTVVSTAKHIHFIISCKETTKNERRTNNKRSALRSLKN